MNASAALLERPLWELALGATSLAVACILGAVIFFWIGFRIAEVSALVGLEEMFSPLECCAGSNAGTIPPEVAARLQAIQDRPRPSEEMSAPARSSSHGTIAPEEPQMDGIDRQL